ncbi:MAG: DUF3365 domain-containing protein [Myxococcota bacterium]
MRTIQIIGVVLVGVGCQETSVVESPSPRPAPMADANRVEPDQLSSAEHAQWARAKAAKKELAQALSTTLKAAVQEGDYARGIEVCRGAAPEITAAVAGHPNLEIGRTAERLRNPNNRPPAWAAPWVARAERQEVILRSEEGIRALFPIVLAEPCVHCHGSAGDIPDEVKGMLGKLYPEDRATGFAPGDLRGWFWVEVNEES